MLANTDIGESFLPIKSTMSVRNVMQYFKINRSIMLVIAALLGRWKNGWIMHDQFDSSTGVMSMHELEAGTT